jgi:hypothetical protein
MTLDIKPQDKRPLEKIEFELHPDLIVRLKSFAQSLEDSDVSYVLTQVLEQALPSEKPARRPRAERVARSSKETPRRAA